MPEGKREAVKYGQENKRPGPQLRDRAIVIRYRKLGEADRIVVFLTEKEGKRSAVAKSMRKTKSSFGGRLEPASFVDVLLYRGRNLGIVRQVQTIESFRELREDLDLFTYASAMLELAERATHEYEPSEVFGLLLTALRELKAGGGQPAMLLSMFDLKVLSVSGFGPALYCCVSCGRETTGDRPLFSLKMGGVLCESCGSKKRGGMGRRMRVHSKALEEIRWMKANDIRDWREYGGDISHLGEVRNLTERFLEYWFEKEFKSHKMLKTLTEGEE